MPFGFGNFGGGQMQPFGQMTPGGGTSGAPLQPTGVMPMNTGIVPPAQQQPQTLPAVSWPGQTPDGSYANNLAQMYAGTLQNQQVPGSLPLMAPQQPGTTPAPAPAPGGHGPFGGQGGFGGHGLAGVLKQQLFGWRQNQPAFGSGQGAMQQWMQQRPSMGALRHGGY